MARLPLAFLLVAILALASFLRLWRLDAIPPGVFPDEAMNATNAITALETGTFQVFYQDNNGREGLFMNLIAVSFALFGISVWSFKVVPAVIGILTVLGQYLCTKEIFTLLKSKSLPSPTLAPNPILVALLSAFFLATSFWHINFSRVDFRAIQMPFVLVFSFYYLFRGFRTRKIFDFIAAGVIFGIGFHTYISFRVAAFLLGAIIFFWFFIAVKEKWAGAYTRACAALLFFVWLAALPLILYFAQNPQDFSSRTAGVMVFKQENPALAFGTSLIKHLGMFNVYGDPNWRHNFAGSPQLFLPVGIFFLFGAAYGLRKIFGAIGPATLIYGFLFAWFFILLLPGVLTFEGIPHSLRVIGVIPAVFVFAALGAYVFFRWLGSLKAVKNLRAPAQTALLLFFCLLLTISAFYAYFIAWGARAEVSDAFTKRFTDAGYALNALPLGVRKFVIKSEGDLPVEVPKFIQKTAGRNDAIYIDQNKISTTRFERGDFIFTMNRERAQLDELRERFPNGELQELERIWVYQVR